MQLVFKSSKWKWTNSLYDVYTFKKNRNGVPVPSNPWAYSKTTVRPPVNASTSRSPGRLASLPDCLLSFHHCYEFRRPIGPSSFMLFTADWSANALNTWRQRRSVNEGGSDSLSVRRRRAGWRTGRHAQCWEKSKSSIISYEIDSISINRIKIESKLD